MLRLLPRFKQSQIIRTREPALLEKCEIVVDVGGKFDGKKFFDHHQRDFNITFSANFATKLSSAGLIYKHFGIQILREILKESVPEKTIGELHPLVYKSQEFIESVDANDNGISAYDSLPESKFKEADSILTVVSNFNPCWNEVPTEVDEMKRFVKASNFIGGIFVDKVQYYAHAWLPVFDIVRTAFEKRKNLDTKGRIVVFEQYAPWKQFLSKLEQEIGTSDVLYVIYPDTSKGWRIQAAPIEPYSFKSRKALPEPWRGLKGDELSKISKVNNCVFCHASGFVGGNESKEGALEMAKKAINFEE